MINLITENNSIRIDWSLISKNSVFIIKTAKGVRMSDVDGAYFMDIDYKEATLDGIPAMNPQNLFDFLKVIGFNSSASTPVQDLFDDLNRLVANGILVNSQTYNLSI